MPQEFTIEPPLSFLGLSTLKIDQDIVTPVYDLCFYSNGLPYDPENPSRQNCSCRVVEKNWENFFMRFSSLSNIPSEPYKKTVLLFKQNKCIATLFGCFYIPSKSALPPDAMVFFNSDYVLRS